MFFSRVALFALPAIAAATVLPRGGGNSCNIGSSQYCCNNVQSASTFSEADKGLLSLIGVDVSGIVGQVGLACNPISVPVGILGTASSSSNAGCTQQNVCCQGSQASGLIANNCSPVIINA